MFTTFLSQYLIVSWWNWTFQKAVIKEFEIYVFKIIKAKEISWIHFETRKTVLFKHVVIALSFIILLSSDSRMYKRNFRSWGFQITHFRCIYFIYCIYEQMSFCNISITKMTKNTPEKWNKVLNPWINRL